MAREGSSDSLSASLVWPHQERGRSVEPFPSDPCQSQIT